MDESLDLADVDELINRLETRISEVPLPQAEAPLASVLCPLRICDANTHQC
ncbi:hypothetical protein GCM10012275_00820 [Longimycelium tulufanense]|uniref:Uncharacterized protein n=1 Tax=Longimycelium tulufanense TaxID=907463 RepID=A0A8J3C942_9PSEU|nr:hypothetical protein [Longimycelium tulufanense]GGM33200.1 hypothetical protein GCM10012275_00820 [Longimycelium tulufanense]